MPRRKNKPLNTAKMPPVKGKSNQLGNTFLLKVAVDPVSGLESQIIKILAGHTVKDYICPHCNQRVLKSTSHIVVVPTGSPDLRRHWHETCFNRVIKQKSV